MESTAQQEVVEAAGSPLHGPRRALKRSSVQILFVLWCAVWTLLSASAFYRSLIEQTGGEWSAPLDDVFIHFDYARATALGHPFEWVAGNGYSSGNTSLSYPFVLAFGWLVGFRELSLMVWAAWIACLSVFGLMLAVGRAVRGPAAFLAAPLLVGVGALAWSLWSGMEVAFFLALWGAALVAFDHLGRTRVQADPARRRRAMRILAACGVAPRGHPARGDRHHLRLRALRRLRAAPIAARAGRASSPASSRPRSSPW